VSGITLCVSSRSLFACLFVCFYCLLFMSVLLCNVCLSKAKFHYAIQLASRSQTSSRPNSIALSIARNQLASRSATSSRAGRRPASEQDIVMEYGLLWRNGIWPEPICDQVRVISTCRDSSNLSATSRKPRLQPGLRPG